MMGNSHPGDWQCACGATNADVADRCYRCGRLRPPGGRAAAPGPAAVYAPPGSALPVEGACLAGLSLRQAGRVLPLDPTRPLTLGRAATSDLLLEGEATVSAQHARLLPMPPYFAVEDLGSTNGTFVNGERVVERRMLSFGDVLQFG